jgi:hypothetical protein
MVESGGRDEVYQTAEADEADEDDEDEADKSTTASEASTGVFVASHNEAGGSEEDVHGDAKDSDDRRGAGNGDEDVSDDDGEGTEHGDSAVRRLVQDPALKRFKPEFLQKFLGGLDLHRNRPASPPPNACLHLYGGAYYDGTVASQHMPSHRPSTFLAQKMLNHYNALRATMLASEARHRRLMASRRRRIPKGSKGGPVQEVEDDTSLGSAAGNDGPPSAKKKKSTSATQT